MKYKKILIFGLTGTGKSTFAKKVSKITKLKVYHLDDLAYKKKWTQPATKEEFVRRLTKIVKKKKWILEGVHHEWLEKAKQKPDLILFINPNKIIRTKRILLRSKRNKTPLKQTVKLIYWATRWGPKWYRKHKKDAKEFVEIKNQKELNELLKNLK